MQMRTSISDGIAKTKLKQMKSMFLNKIIICHLNTYSISSKFEEYFWLKKILMF